VMKTQFACDFDWSGEAEARRRASERARVFRT
jgi:hypothetical protein